MLKFNIHTEEKITKAQKHKKLTLRFEKKSNKKTLTLILELIKSFI